ncbi:WD40 repeat-like protein [Polyplosphaeria fusca]|uniref:WD40 repeat-like protein n=1 Tax=Polyplosphaeria fusca TaxID=682080 RepID=A0A9P4QTD8_9PLEO|nr:WD40 repeat-like protein [Polyplosphaeria fusca]
MAKRKRDVAEAAGPLKTSKVLKEKGASAAARPAPKAASKSNEASADTHTNGTANGRVEEMANGDAVRDTTIVQIITGSYERVLHGFTATIPRAVVTGYALPEEDSSTSTTFADTFLFNAHTSSIRCLALSPISPDSTKVTLATGSTDERINLYSLSTTPPPPSSNPNPTLSLTTTPTSLNPHNKPLGSLLHHTSSLTTLHFPTRSKLLSAAQDSTIAITRTRDWTPLSSIRAPIPTPHGRPSGDTAGPGEVPSGVSSFAVHPSLKLMLSVSRGEKCMRLWNLVTGKKAGVLNFSRKMLAAVHESRFASGEARSVVWDAAGEEFAVAWERGVLVFGLDCRARGCVVLRPRAKVHRVAYLESRVHGGTVVVGTEDGRVAFYDTGTYALQPDDAAEKKEEEEDEIPHCTLLAQIGGPAKGISGRVKDFEILKLDSDNDEDNAQFLLVTGSSDGAVRLWAFSDAELTAAAAAADSGGDAGEGGGFAARQAGRLVGVYATNSRITCLRAFVMIGEPEEVEEGEEKVEEQKDGDSSSSGSESKSE